MAAAHQVMDIPPLHCVVRQVDPKKVHPEKGFTLEDKLVHQFVTEMRAAMPDDVDVARGIILHMDHMFAAFDGQFDEVHHTLGLVLKDGVEVAAPHVGHLFPAASVLELRFPPARSFKDILKETYAAATGFAAKSRKRDLGDFLRIHDLRGVKKGGGFLVQVETWERDKAED